MVRPMESGGPGAPNPADRGHANPGGGDPEPTGRRFVALEREARSQLAMAAAALSDEAQQQLADLLDVATPATVAQLVLRAAGRLRRGDAQDDFSALYQVALEYREHETAARVLLGERRTQDR